MLHENWTIAFRKRDGEKCLLDDTKKAFRVIPNTWRYWCADPHLFDYKGDTYVFAELYDRVLRRGVIGCCKIVDDKSTEWKVALKAPYHLSYPHIFYYESDVYMIPESYVAREIAVYKSEKFPNKWKKICVLKKDYVAVDSTMFTYRNTDWMLTLQFENNHEYLNLFHWDNEKKKRDELCVGVDDVNKRPAGKVFWSKGKMIRPTQDCSRGYGCALNFCEVVTVEETKYEELLVKKILPTEIQSNLKKVPEGIHTYNQNEKYEVIDLKGYEIDLLFYITRPIWYIWRRIRKVLSKNGI